MSENGTDEELEQQAHAMAEKTLASLPESIRASKFGKIKEGILKRLKDQLAKSGVPTPSPAGAPAPPTAPGGPPPPPPTPPPEAALVAVEKLEGIEALGDDPWFADAALTRSLREAVVAAHAAQKILVGAPADEIRRICPGGGRVLGAGAVLRLGGATLGGYGEADVAYAYRQLSRALHPDKNPDVPEAQDAFKRLTEAADELKAGLQEQRSVLRGISAALGGQTTPEMLERPQGALFAEATRMLFAVLALSGEGEVPVFALSRGAAAFASSPIWGQTQALGLLSEWYDQPRLLDLLAGAQLRTAYDCAKKRLRAQFLCALNRCTLAEAKRHNDCIRGNWQAVMMQFPEIGLWREMCDKLKTRVWSRQEIKRHRGSMWDDEEGPRASPWAKVWRERIAAVLPRGMDAAVPWTDSDVRKLCAALWRDIAEWARGSEGDLARHLQLFTAEPAPSPGPEAPPEEWAFVPAADMLLLVGEGVVGITAEGLFAEKKPGHERMSWEEALAGKWERQEREASGEEEREGKEKRDPGFDWEQVWRQRMQSNRSRRTRATPPRRSASRERRRNSRSRERRRSRSRERRRDRRRSRSRRRDRDRDRGRSD